MIGQISHREALPLLQKVRDKVKESEVYQDLCKEHKVDEDIIDLVPMALADLEVSARTEKGCIYFNYALEAEELDSYMAHELTHFFQQAFGDGPTQGSTTSEDYLDNEYEQEGFQAQTKYISETRGDDEAEAYVEQVLNHHDVPKKEKNKRKKDLLELAHLAGIYKKAARLEVPEGFKDYANLVTEIIAGWALADDSLDVDTKLFAQNFAQTSRAGHFTEFIIPMSFLLSSKYFEQRPLDWSKISSWPLEDGVKVFIIQDDGSSRNLALWNYDQKIIYIYVNMQNIHSAQSLRSVILEARMSFRHELAHAIQYLGKDIIHPQFGEGPKHKERVGPDRRKLRPKAEKPSNEMTEEEQTQLKEELAHNRPHEFQTYLGDAINILNDINQEYDSFEEKRENFKWFVNGSPFLINLEKYNPDKYRKAIIELYRATVVEPK